MELAYGAIVNRTIMTGCGCVLSLPNLPAKFVGREKDVDMIMSLLREEGSNATRWVCVSAEESVGKSVCAVALAKQAVDDKLFGGLAYVRLSQVDTEQDVLDAVAKATKVKMTSSGVRTPLLQWAERLTTRFLLLLDNAEDPMQAQSTSCQDSFVGLLEEMMRSSNMLTIVLTSRVDVLPASQHPEAPRSSNPASSLPCIYRTHCYRLDPLDKDSAVMLVKELAPCVKHDDAKEIARLCKCIPVELQTLASIIGTGKLDLDSIMNSSDVIATILKHISDDMRITLVYITVFTERFNLEAAATVLKCTSEMAKMKLKDLQDAKLLDYDEHAQRYKVHRVIKDTVRKQSTQVPQWTCKDSSALATAAHLGFAQHIASMVKKADDLFNEGRTVSAMRVFDSVRSDLHKLLAECGVETLQSRLDIKTDSIPSEKNQAMVGFALYCIHGCPPTDDINDPDDPNEHGSDESILLVDLLGDDQTRVDAIQTMITEIAHRSQTDGMYLHYVQIAGCVSILESVMPWEKHALFSILCSEAAREASNEMARAKSLSSLVRAFWRCGMNIDMSVILTVKHAGEIAMEIHETKVLSGDNLSNELQADAAETCNHLGGWLYHAQKAFDVLGPMSAACWMAHFESKSRDLFRHALEIREQALPENHPFIADGIHNLASTDDNWEKSIEGLLRALDMKNTWYKDAHPSISVTLNALAKTRRLVDGEDSEITCKWREDSLENNKLSLGNQHEATRHVMRELLRAYENLSMYEKMIPILKELIAAEERVLGIGAAEVIDNREQKESIVQYLAGKGDRPAIYRHLII
ncbi:hypothetical protein CYMTET_23349 [Cymbomonas tetramitiformis]|uniref:Uncharacterized protein n=1 Tax=Cymbomonas tetramitiformis TaxID=36881 RepID=A0AAE0L1C8_9CHLO|nr:hypothetical protein CYMTET_23349 [Cymbomonas tetramitiformis]|eukprot:gene10186-12053_t